MTRHFVSRSMDDYPLTLTSIVERAERFHADREVVSLRPSGAITRTTLGACAGRARRLAGALTGLGVREGDRVATLLWNQSEHLELYFAVPAMGAVIHTLNPRLFSDELAFIVDDAQDKVIVVDESLLEVFDTFRAGHDFAHVIVVTHTGEAPAGMLDYESLVADGEPVQWPELDERHSAAMCYTSGTTGRPKGVVYSHRALVLHSLVAALPDQLAVSARDTILPVVPMFHANAWGLPYAAALAGARLVLPGPRLDPDSVLDLLADERVTMTAGVPTVWMGMLAAIDAEPYRWDLSALDRLVVGGAAVPQSMFEGYDRHGLTVIQAWGMTETAPLGTVCRLPGDLDESERGRPVPATAPDRASPAPSSTSAPATTTASSSRGTTPPWASSRSAAPGSRRATTAARAPTASPPTAGSRPETWSASTAAGASGSATGPRTSSSPGASGSPPSTWKTSS